jgi:hypothetical protein
VPPLVLVCVDRGALAWPLCTTKTPNSGIMNRLNSA